MRSKLDKVLFINLGHDLNEKKKHDVGRLNNIHDTLKNSTSDTVKI